MSQSFRRPSGIRSSILRNLRLRFLLFVLFIGSSFYPTFLPPVSRVALAFQTAQSPLQRRSTPPPTNARSMQCQQQQAEWSDNLRTRSLVTGAIVFFIVLVFLLTPLGFSTPFVRMFWAFGVAIVLGPAIVGLQKYTALKVCPEPIGFIGILTADLFYWTLVGVLVTAILIVAIRYPFTKRRLNTRPTA